MRTTLPIIALILAAPLLVANQEVEVFGPEPAPVDIDDRFLLDPQTICNDRIMTIRQERGLPLLDRGTADADDPILFYALDHEVDGCDVLLTGDGEVRPIPVVPEGPLRPQPAR